MNTIIFITNKHFNGYVARQEARALKKHGTSYDRSSIDRAANPFVYDIRSNGVMCDWDKCKRAMRARADSIQDILE